MSIIATSDSKTFDRIISMEDKSARDANIASNDAFMAAMIKAGAKGRERVTPGTFVDTTPPLTLRRYYGEPFRSACGSPSALCVDIGARGDGAQTMKG